MNKFLPCLATLLLFVYPKLLMAQEPAALSKAEWIQSPYMQFGIQRPPLIFRKEFNLRKAVKSARLFITSHGIYEGHLNGKRIGQDYFAPGLTNYPEKLQYQVYQIEPQWLKDSNLIDVVVGDGWWRGFNSGTQNKFGTDLGLLCALEITFTDKTKMIVNSDESWQYGTGAIRFSDFEKGERSDGNQPVKMDGQARVFLTSRHQLAPTVTAAVQKQEMLNAVKVTGDSLYDFGHQLEGWIRFSIKGDHRDSIVIKHAIDLNDKGDLLLSLAVEPAFDNYILKGGAVENYEPHFTFHKFRYAKLLIYRNGQRVNRLVRPLDVKAIKINAGIKPLVTSSKSEK